MQKIITHIFIPFFGLMICSTNPYASTNDSSQLGPQNHRAMTKTADVDMDAAKCTEPTESYNLDLHHAAGSTIPLSHTYKPGACPQGYVMVNFQNMVTVSGIYNSGLRLVMRTHGNRYSYRCCPLKNSWKAVAVEKVEEQEENGK